MPYSDFQDLGKNAKKLAPISTEAITSLKENLPKLLNLVDEKFAVDARYCCDKEVADQQRILKDCNGHFGRMFLAVCQFQLFESLVNEFSWFITTLSRRGFKRTHFEKFLDTWIASIHGILGPSPARELVQPLRFLKINLPLFLEVDISAADRPQNETILKLVRLLLEKKRREASEFALATLANKHVSSVEDFFTAVLAPSLQFIGRLWQVNKISAADEHAATEIWRYIIFRLFDSLPREKLSAARALVSCVEGEEHTLAGELISEYFNLKGWLTHFIGRSAPRDDIVQAAVTSKPDVIFLSVTLVSNLPHAQDLANVLKKNLPQAKIIFGGRAALVGRDVLSMSSDAVVPDLKSGFLKALEMVDSDA